MRHRQPRVDGPTACFVAAVLGLVALSWLGWKLLRSLKLISFQTRLITVTIRPMMVASSPRIGA
jgi:hypothetical protein